MAAIVFNSNEVKVFPTQQRDDQYDRKARFATDTNIANLGMSLTSKQGFVMRGCNLTPDGTALTASPDTFHAIWLGGIIFNINRPTISLPTKRTSGKVLVDGDILTFHIRQLHGSNQGVKNQIGVICTLNNGADSNGKYGGLELLAESPTIMTGDGDYYAPVAVWSGAKWVAYELKSHKNEAKDISVYPQAVPTPPSTGATGNQSLEQYIAYNTVIDDGGLIAEAGKQLNRLKLKRASHSQISESASVDLHDGETIIDTDRNYLLKGATSAPQNYKPIRTNEVSGYASELSPDGNTYTAQSSPTRHFRFYGANTEVRFDVAQGTPWKVRSGNTEVIIYDNSPTPKLKVAVGKVEVSDTTELTDSSTWANVNAANKLEGSLAVGKKFKVAGGAIMNGGLSVAGNGVAVSSGGITASGQTVTATTFTGNAGTSTKLQTARTIAVSGKATGTATPFDGTGNITIPITALSQTASDYPVLNQNTTGNAGTATKLQTARTVAISGKATGTATVFDGTGNINIPITALSQTPSDYPVLNQNTTGNAGTATKLQTARTVAISGKATGTAIVFDGTGNINIPITALSQTPSDYPVLHTKGVNILLSGQTISTSMNPTFTEVKANKFIAQSDIRLKSNIIPISKKDISAVSTYEFDKQNVDGRQVGVIAQELRECFPELVCEDDDEQKTLAVLESKFIYYLMDEVRRLKEELRGKNIIE